MLSGGRGFIRALVLALTLTTVSVGLSWAPTSLGPGIARATGPTEYGGVGWSGDGQSGTWACWAPGPGNAILNCHFDSSVPVPAAASKVRITVTYREAGNTDSCSFAWGSPPQYYSGGTNFASDSLPSTRDFGVPYAGARWFMEGHNDTDWSGSPHIICSGSYQAMTPDVGWTGDGRTGTWECSAPGPDGAPFNCKFGWSVPVPVTAAFVRVTVRYFESGNTDACRFAWGSPPQYYSFGDNLAGAAVPATRTYAVPGGAIGWYIEAHNDTSSAIRTICSGTYEALNAQGLPLELVDPQLQYAGTGTNPNERNPTGFLAEPVNTYSGNYVTATTDLALPGRGVPFAFGRTYNSVVSVPGPLGPGWTHPFAATLVVSPDGSATFQSDDGAVIPFAANGSGGFNPDPGVLSTLTAVSTGYTITRADQLKYHFDPAGKLTSESDRNGNALTFGYTNGDLTTITDTVGRIVNLTYDVNHRLTGLTDPIGRRVAYAYDGTGHLATATDVRGGIVRYTYDTGGRLATMVDANLHTVVANTYSPDGRVATQLDARNNQTTFAWNPTSQVATITDSRGGVTTDTYSGAALISRRDPTAGVTRFSYDAAFNRTSATDPRGNTTTMTYDARGNLLTTMAPAPLSYQQSITYDAQNNLLTATDGRGHTMTDTYDAAGNLTRTTYADSTFTTFTRDPAGTGLLVGSTDPRGKTTALVYDALANVRSVTSPLGEVTTMTYDGAGRRLSLVDPRGNVVGADPAQYTTTYAHDAANHLLSSTDPLGDVTRFAYDAAGNRTTVTDPNSHTTTYGYDAANHLTSVTDAALKVTAYAYDTTGNLVVRTDANNHATTYGYDLAGRLTTTTDPLNHSSTVGYDAAGDPTSRTDANGNTSTYAYDVLGRVSGIAYANSSTPAVTFAYDANGNRTSMTDGSGTETYAFDLFDRLIGATRGSDGFVYAYDAAGNIATRTYPDGMTTTYGYDGDGRLDSATSMEPVPPPADTTAPSTPGGLTASAVSAGQINLAWTASTDAVGVQGYKIYRGGTYLASVGPVGSVSLSDTGLTVSTAYSYTVSAIDAAGNESAQSSAAVATTLGPDTAAPSAPTGLTATAAAYNQVGLAWTGATDNVGVTRYSIYRGGTLLSVVAGTITSFTDRSTVLSTAYSYTVKASDAAGNTGAASAAAPVTTPACSSCVTTTTFNSVADAYVSSAAGQRTRNFGTTTTLLVARNGDKKAFIKFDLTSLPAGTIAGATLRVYPDTSDAAGVGGYASTTTSWTETGITYSTAPAYGALLGTSGAATAGAWAQVNVGSAVTVRGLVTLVIADTGSSNGTYESRENTNKPQLVVTTTSPPPADTTAPSTPGGLTASAVSAGQINLAWTASTDAVGVQGYKIYRGGTYLASVGPVGSVSLSDTGLTVSTAYSYTVSAIDAAGNESAQSSAAVATTLGPDTAAPSAPTGLTATAAAYNQVGLAWTGATDNVGVTRYSIYRGGTLLSVVAGTITSFTDRSTVLSTAYSYTVKASDAAGNTGAASAAAPVTTPGLPTAPATTLYAYDPAGELLTASSPDGVTAKSSYDRAGRLLEVANVTASGTLSRFSYAMDPAGNRLITTTTRGSQYDTYDVLNRLSGVCYASICAGTATPVPCLGCVGSPVSTPAATTVPAPADTSTTWAYDPVGNRLTQATYQGTTSYAYDAADRLTSVTAPGSVVTTYGYDANGNETAAGSNSYSYDLADRLASATVSSTTQTYTYAGDGVRLSAATSPAAANTTQFVVDRSFNLPQVAIERDGTGTTLRRYIYGLDRISEKTPSPTPFYYHHDGLGSVSDVTSSIGASLAWTEYQPFGQFRSAGTAAGTPANPFLFAGQYQDSSTSLYYLRARQYDPTTGRFTATDPLPGSVGDPYVGAYVYVQNNPVGLVDPSGRCVEILAAAVAGLATGPGDAAIAPASALATGLCIAAFWAAGVVAVAVVGPKPAPPVTVFQPQGPPTQRPPGEDPFKNLKGWAKAVAITTIISIISAALNGQNDLGEPLVPNIKDTGRIQK